MNLGHYLNVLLIGVHPVHQNILLSNSPGSIQIKLSQGNFIHILDNAE